MDKTSILVSQEFSEIDTERKKLTDCNNRDNEQTWVWHIGKKGKNDTATLHYNLIRRHILPPSTATVPGSAQS